MEQIRPETAGDLAAIREVHRQAFGRPDEAELVDALRAGHHLRLSLVLEREGEILGHVAFSEVAIETESQSLAALSLAPLAVLPARQRQGIGSRLVRAGLELAAELGHRAVIVLGDPNFYPRFGFSHELALPLDAPFSGPAWMAAELVPGALHGVAGRVVYPPPFGQL